MLLPSPAHAQLLIIPGSSYDVYVAAAKLVVYETDSP